MNNRFFKEDIEREELDDHIYRLEREYEERKEWIKPSKLILGKRIKRHKNRINGKLKIGGERIPF